MFGDFCTLFVKNVKLIIIRIYSIFRDIQSAVMGLALCRLYDYQFAKPGSPISLQNAKKIVKMGLVNEPLVEYGERTRFKQVYILGRELSFPNCDLDVIDTLLSGGADPSCCIVNLNGSVLDASAILDQIFDGTAQKFIQLCDLFIDHAVYLSIRHRFGCIRLVRRLIASGARLDKFVVILPWVYNDSRSTLQLLRAYSEVESDEASFNVCGKARVIEHTEMTTLYIER